MTPEDQRTLRVRALSLTATPQGDLEGWRYLIAVPGEPRFSLATEQHCL